jgi:outer membrane cobalamin receptor
VGGGLRTDRVLDLGALVGGWAQAQVALSQDLVLTVAASRHGQAPDVLQRFGPAATPDLAFERAELVDGGLAWRRGPWGVSVNAYLRREADGLDTPGRQFRLTPEGTVTGGNPRAPWLNVLTGRARGVEVLVRRQSASGARGLRWSGWIGYGYGRATYGGDADPSFAGAFDQRHLTTLSATAQLGDRWDISGTVRLATNWPYEGWFEQRADGRIYLSAQRNDLRIPDYGRLDLRLRHGLPLPHGRLMLFAEVINATNAENLRQVSASINPRTGAVGRLSEQQLPIIPAVGIAFEF